MTLSRKHNWVEEYPGSITVCDRKGVILEMNRRSAESFRKQGGKKLIGQNLMDCHPEPARTKLKRLIRREQTNVYTVKKGRVVKIVLQTPWYKNNRYRGFVEVSVPITGKIPNIVRKS